jgi:hypothetical protein
MRFGCLYLTSTRVMSSVFEGGEAGGVGQGFRNTTSE